MRHRLMVLQDGVAPGAMVAAALALLIWLFLPPGIYLGGDWVLPATPQQAGQFLHPYVWSSEQNFGQPSLIGALGLTFGALVVSLMGAGLPVAYLGKTLLLVVGVGAFLFTYLFLRHERMSQVAAVAGGLVYVTTPVFFNYAAMGWIFVLLAMALFPLTLHMFSRSIQEHDSRLAVAAALVWSIAVLQSQALVWIGLLLLAMAPHLIHDKAEARFFARHLAIVLIVFLGLNCYWWLGLLIFQDAEITSSAIVFSEPSVGADSRFDAVNAVRAWGGLFNFQYETALASYWVAGAWMLPMLALLGVAVAGRSRRRLALAFALIAFVLPAALLILKNNREILALIPGSGLVRQLSRFTVLTSFAYAVLVAVVIDEAWTAASRVRWVVPPLLVLLAAAAGPWWAGDLTNHDASLRVQPDFRLRPKSFPADYLAAEARLEQLRLATQALYLPYGMSVTFSDDPAYRGDFKASIDVFARFSPVPGMFMPTDRPSPVADFTAGLGRTDDLPRALAASPVNLFVIRRNIDPRGAGRLVLDTRASFPEPEYELIWDSPNVAIVARVRPLPLVFVPERRILEGGPLDLASLARWAADEPTSVAVAFADQNRGQARALAEFGRSTGTVQSVEFRRINPTKVRIRLHGARGQLPIVFGESYSRGWQLYPIRFAGEVQSAITFFEVPAIVGNERYQASSAELREFVRRGWVSALDATGAPRLVTKRLFGTIQNDHLSGGSVWETWASAGLSPAVHLKVNGHANAWLIDTEALCGARNGSLCRRAGDGAVDLELVLEFWPQRLFQVGLIVSLLVLLGCAAFMALGPCGKRRYGRNINAVIGGRGN